MSDTLFDKIVRGEIESRIVWEDDRYMAFLTPFPNTPGVTVVIPKSRLGDYVFALDTPEYTEFLTAVKTVANILEKAFNTARIGLVFEGTGVAYVHAKLYPFHGPLATATDLWSDTTEFTDEYRGWMTTIEGPRMDDAQLDAIQAKIIAAQQ